MVESETRYSVVKHYCFPTFVVKSKQGPIPDELSGQYTDIVKAQVAIDNYLFKYEQKEEQKQEREVIKLKREDYLKRKQAHADKKAKQAS